VCHSSRKCAHLLAAAQLKNSEEPPAAKRV
jgi:hypothetical protein